MNTQRLIEMLGPAAWAEGLIAGSPKFAEGLASAVAVIHSDGALPARDKALCAAVIGAVKRLPEVTSKYLTIAIDRGMTPDEVHGAAINVLISRGIPGYQALTEALAAISDAGVSPGPSFEAEVSMDAILDYYKGLYGEVPANVALGAQHAPGAVVAYYLMRQAALEESPLENRLADVMLCAINAAEFRDDFVEIHARFALKGGATAGQLTEAVACAIPFAGVAAWLAGANGLIAALENP